MILFSSAGLFRPGNESSLPWKILPIAAVCVLGGFSTLHAQTQTGPFNYGEALQKSIFFYDAQRSGTLPANNRVNWRANDYIHDGSDVGLDLSGGFHDAGDHVKFGLPFAYSMTMLSWSVIEYRQAFANAGQLTAIMNNIRWGTDYIIKAHPSPNVLYGQVGQGSIDHQVWAAPELFNVTGGITVDRPAWAITATCPGSDLAGQTAAAMAAASMVFQPTDPTYAATLLQHAQQLYTFADTYRGIYSNCIKDAAGYYASSGYNDELVWGAIWLYKASGNAAYLTKAVSYFPTLNQGFHWTVCWDDVTYGSYLLLAKILNTAPYTTLTQEWLDWWSVGVNGGPDRISYSPGGEAYLTGWGSLRYPVTTSFAALVYSDFITDPTLKKRWHDFAVGQIGYVLGNNPTNRSYLIGFGANPYLNVHNRAAHSSWQNSMAVPVNNRHVLYGGLMGGPASANDVYVEDRTNYATTETGLDYSAALPGALARLYQEYGGAPLANFPQPETPTNPEISVSAVVNQTGTNFTEIQSWLMNQTGWPPRVTSDLSFRYFFTLDGTTTPSQISVVSYYSECAGSPLSGPFQWSGNVYYANVDCTGTPLAPDATTNFQKQILVRITSVGVWDPTNDYSYQGIAPKGNAPVPMTNITAYEAGKLVWGTEPPRVNCTAVPAAPTGLTTMAASSVISLSWTAPAAPANCSITSYTVFRSTTSGFVPSASNQIASGLTSASYSDIGLTPSTTYYYSVEAVDAAGASPASAQAAGTTTAATAGLACHIGYSITNQWPGGFQAAITIGNTGTAPIANWTLTWAFANGQTVTQLWGGTETQSGANVTVVSPSYAGPIPAGGSYTAMGFTGTWNSTANAVPTSFAVNGTTCR